MDRDRRITGSLRGQSDNPVPPIGFELNNPWKVRRLTIGFPNRCSDTFHPTVRKAEVLSEQRNKIIQSFTMALRFLIRF